MRRAVTPACGLALLAAMLPGRHSRSDDATTTVTTAAATSAALPIFTAHCGQCHDSRLPTAKPAALAVFDLTTPDWWTRLSDRRLPILITRAPAAERAAIAAQIG